MMACLTDDDKAILNELGYLTIRGSIDRKKLAESVARILRSTHVVKSAKLGEAERVGIMTEQLLDQLGFPEHSEGLLKLMASLLTTSHSGAVQRSLPNGWVLGKCRATRNGILRTENGAEVRKSTKVPVHWITKDEDTVVALILDLIPKRQDERAKRDRNYFAMLIERQPGLDGLIRQKYLPTMCDTYNNGLYKGFAPELEEADEPRYSSPDKQASYEQWLREKQQAEEDWEQPRRQPPRKR